MTFTECDHLKAQPLLHLLPVVCAGGCLLLKLPSVVTTLIPEVSWYLTECSPAPLLPHACAARHFGTKEKAEVAFKTSKIPVVSVARTQLLEEERRVLPGVRIVVWPHINTSQIKLVL